MIEPTLSVTTSQACARTIRSRIPKRSLGSENNAGQAHMILPEDQTERQGFDRTQIYKVLESLCLHLNAGNANDLARLVDVLKLHGFLPSFDAR